MPGTFLLCSDAAICPAGGHLTLQYGPSHPAQVAFSNLRASCPSSAILHTHLPLLISAGQSLARVMCPGHARVSCVRHLAGLPGQRQLNLAVLHILHTTQHEACPAARQHTLSEHAAASEAPCQTGRHAQWVGPGQVTGQQHAGAHKAHAGCLLPAASQPANQPAQASIAPKLGKASQGRSCTPTSSVQMSLMKPLRAASFTVIKDWVNYSCHPRCTGSIRVGQAIRVGHYC